MGRPQGSLNKKTLVVMKKKRGRPKKVVEVEVEVEEVSKVTTAKFLGYCPKCKSMIGNPDLVSKFIFECPSCGKRARVKLLAKDIGDVNRPMSKKEYLDGALNTSYHQLPLNDHQIDPEHLKIQDI